MLEIPAHHFNCVSRPSVGDIQLWEQRAEANAVPEAFRKLIFNGQIVSRPAVYDSRYSPQRYFFTD
ncbi:MAG: hypothetical protein V8T38_02505 [Oscillospiraceae bacterium]